jgi:hypothetical protein
VPHADSIKEVAVNTTLKLMHFLNTTHIPLAASTLQPKNAFPLTYRAQPLAADVLPALNPPDLQLDSLINRVVSRQAGQGALLGLLLQQKEPVTVIATGMHLIGHCRFQLASHSDGIWSVGQRLPKQLSQKINK